MKERTNRKLFLPAAVVLCVSTALLGWFGGARYSLARTRRRPKKLGYAGVFDGVVDGEARGWVVDRDRPAEPVQATVYVNRHPVACRAAVYYRPDVGELLETSGSHGFYIDIAEYLENDGAIVEVRLPDDTPLEHGSVEAMTVKRAAKRLEKPTVLFMHIPKTAGTAFREAIAQNFRLSEIAYIYPAPPGFLVSDLRALPLEQRRALRMVMGHFQVGMHEALPQFSDYITIVREPGARVLSQFAYLQQMQPGPATQALTLEQLFATRLTVDFDNALVRCFSGVHERECLPGCVNEEILEQAIRNLRTRFAFVGHQENAQKAFEELRQLYGWTAPESLPEMNRGTVRLPAAADAGIRELIRHYNTWDWLLYEEICAVFPRPAALTQTAAG